MYYCVLYILSLGSTVSALKVPNKSPEQWILNGVVEQMKDGVLYRHKMVTPFRKTVMVNNTLLEYSGSNSVEERINITMMINSPLELMVSHHDSQLIGRTTGKSP